MALEHVATIHDASGEAGLSPPAPQSIVRTSAGHFFVITTNPFRPLHFDETGTFIGELGREGEGPGEYRNPFSALHGPGDTIWILDRSLPRRTGWSPTGEYLGSEPLPTSLVHGVILEDRSIILSGAVMEGASIGRPLHRYAPDGELLHSFGTEADVSGAIHIPGWIRRAVAIGGDGTVWAAYLHRYVIERYEPEGALLTTVQRDVGWFPERDPTESTILAEDGPQPAIRGLVEDAQGHLRILLGLPGDNWVEGLGERELQPGFEAAGVYWTPVRDYEQVFRFVIEVVDPETGELLVSHGERGLALGWIDDQHIATYSQDEFDIPIIDVYRVTASVR